MKKIIYMDNSATTKVDGRVKKEMDKYFTEIYGNPGSFNSKGLEAKEALNNVRLNISKILNCSSDEIVFTGSGTESINLAIKGVARANKNKGNHIITTKIEHHAVLDTCEYLKKEGFEITYLDVDKFGLINLEKLEKTIKKETILITIMYANNEIGTIQDIKEISKIAKKHNILFHTDACQAACSLNIDVENLGIDLMTLNSSKIYGPKGVGLLYVKEGTAIKPIIHGGGQERGLRSGTENIPGIVGFAKALEIADKEKKKELGRLTKLRDYMIKNILIKIPNTRLNGHPEKRLPNNVNISFLNIEGEALLLFLDEHGICASTGSACTSKSLEPSHVILALGVPYELAHGSLRFSLGRFNTKEEIDKILEILPSIVEKLRKISSINLKMDDVEK